VGRTGAYLSGAPGGTPTLRVFILLALPIFMHLAFNLSNGVTDTLESSTILIYFNKHMSLYTQKVGRMPQIINVLLKVDEQGAVGAVN
jgi:hypothetical protein